jgi:hypothetical protein
MFLGLSPRLEAPSVKDKYFYILGNKELYDFKMIFSCSNV